jgi:hypothetical protein
MYATMRNLSKSEDIIGATGDSACVETLPLNRTAESRVSPQMPMSNTHLTPSRIGRVSYLAIITSSRIKLKETQSCILIFHGRRIIVQNKCSCVLIYVGSNKLACRRFASSRDRAITKQPEDLLPTR